MESVHLYQVAGRITCIELCDSIRQLIQVVTNGDGVEEARLPGSGVRFLKVVNREREMMIPG